MAVAVIAAVAVVAAAEAAAEPQAEAAVGASGCWHPSAASAAAETSVAVPAALAQNHLLFLLGLSSCTAESCA